MRRLCLLLIALCLAFSALGCSAAAPPQLTAEGRKVKAQKAEPPAGAEEVGPVSGVHGDGCGGFGSLGTYEGAYAELKNAAAAMGANFVRIDIVEAPHQRDRNCYDNTYTLRGVAFIVPETAKSEATATPTTSAVAPATSAEGDALEKSPQ